MKHALLFALALALGLAACSTPATEEPPAGAAPPPLTTDMSCNASAAIHCPLGGCEQGQPVEPNRTPISLFVPAQGGAGNFCIATGCEDAEIEPTLTRALGWTARVTTNDRTAMQAELEIARDERTFRLRWPQDDGVMTWDGECQPAGS